MRKVGFTIGIVIILIVVALVVFAATFDGNRYYGFIQSELENRLGKSLPVAQAHLQLTCRPASNSMLHKYGGASW